MAATGINRLSNGTLQPASLAALRDAACPPSQYVGLAANTHRRTAFNKCRATLLLGDAE